ncbi:putative GTPase activating protein for Arf family protein [Babesia bovis T2Bo]|uniref:Putative GTP-ase activating protein for Arf n=1 Tax=Babesia bovis TaxID=5865 RepID=A7ASN9_BABBO|nr:putative GTPase activating protein for Arf family protein [Babesia bovis T2Bo]EDO07558.1 putative GTPase activating protein for Arf family protein [Babesia bovis T2Bo]|eukprot:XP_001611126.1 Putative GTP-ase activating protein for Arf [Babesia bovis T2Bo]
MEDIANFAIDERGHVSYEARDKVFRQLLSQTDNAVCIDCDARNPTWVSITYAVYLCLNCSGRHRQFGSHISFVRSADMDKFTREQLIRMTRGGNARAKAYFRQCGQNRNPYNYSSPLALKYPAILDAELGIVNEKAGSSGMPGVVQEDLLDLHDEGDVLSATVQDSKPLSNVNETNTRQTQIKSMTLAPGMSKGMRNQGVRSNTYGGTSAGFSGRVNVDFDAFEKSIMNEAKQRGNTIAVNNPVPLGESYRQSPPMALQMNNTVGSAVSSNQPQYSPPDMSKFAGQTSISSDQVFGRGAYSNTAQRNVNLNPNRTSISSDEYFGRPPKPRSSAETFEERAVQNIKDGIATAIKEGNKLVGMAKQWLNKHQL